MLHLQSISKDYDHAPLLRDISFDVADGEIVCLLGPSGTGKTTLLRIIAGLEQPDGGRVLIEGKDQLNIPPHERGIGFMFQDLALFPHRNVFDNIAFGLRMQGMSADEITARVNESLTLVGLDPARFAKRDVNRLSGGEQQRVALARTIAPRPRLIMFDEPLGALDRILREELIAELRPLLKRLHMTALYVTHDQDEAFGIADRLILLNQGHIEQMGTPVEVYQHPANAFVARFMGLTNLIPITRTESRDSYIYAHTDIGTFKVTQDKNQKNNFVLLRPRAIERITSASERGENVLRGQIVEVLLRQGHQRLTLASGAHTLTFEWDGPVTLNTPVVLELDPAKISLLPA